MACEAIGFDQDCQDKKLLREPFSTHQAKGGLQVLVGINPGQVAQGFVLKTIKSPKSVLNM